MNAKVTYTAEQTAELVSAYQTTPTAETVAVFAEKFGKTVKSVIAKLARENVYQAKDKAKTEKAGVTKEAMVKEIGEKLGIEVPSLATATKADLEALIAAL